MKVWVAEWGYDYEGGGAVVGVFSTKEKAIEALKPWEKFGDWHEIYWVILDEPR